MWGQDQDAAVRSVTSKNENLLKAAVKIEKFPAVQSKLF